MPSSTNDSELREALGQGYLTVTTIAKNDSLLGGFDTWVDVNGQRFGINFDRKALLDFVKSSNKQAIQHTLDKLLSEMGGEKKDSKVSPANGDANHSFRLGYNTAHQEFVELINKVKEEL